MTKDLPKACKQGHMFVVYVERTSINVAVVLVSVPWTCMGLSVESLGCSSCLGVFT